MSWMTIELALEKRKLKMEKRTCETNECTMHRIVRIHWRQPHTKIYNFNLFRMR